MLQIKKKNTYRIFNKFNYLFNMNLNILFFYNNILFLKIFMPFSFFFKKEKNKNLYFIFLKKNRYISILKNILNFFKNFFKFFFFRLRLRGLGYKIEKFSLKLYRFFFAYNHYFYFHVPKDIFIKNRKRTLILFSNNLAKINDIFNHLLLLKKLDLYERDNAFIIAKQIKFFKKRK